MPSRFILPTLALALLAAPAARAAESYDNCTGFITSLPATVSAQGVWCLDRDLATAITSGEAITLAGNNITLDCNHFKLGGLAAGTGTLAVGVMANGRNNITVRNCNVRGFGAGISLLGTSQSGHVVEHNRLDGNKVLGIQVQGDGTLVRHNQVLDTGGSTVPLDFNTIAIVVNGSTDVLHNLVSGVEAGGSQSTGTAYGIRQEDGYHSTIIGNTVKTIFPAIGNDAYGIDVSGANVVAVEDNRILNWLGDFVAIRCGTLNNVARDNTLRTPGLPLDQCSDGGGNHSP